MIALAIIIGALIIADAIEKPQPSRRGGWQPRGSDGPGNPPNCGSGVRK